MASDRIPDTDWKEVMRLHLLQTAPAVLGKEPGATHWCIVCDALHRGERLQVALGRAEAETLRVRHHLEIAQSQ